MTRKSIFVRRAAGTSHDVQVIATNIDTVFICMSLNNDFNLRRLERYLSIAWDSGAIPVVVLTKSDLCEDLPERIAEIEKVATGVDILVTSKKLKKEAKYEGLNSRQIEKEKITGMFADFGGIKNARDYIKSKSKK